MARFHLVMDTRLRCQLTAHVSRAASQVLHLSKVNQRDRKTTRLMRGVKSAPRASFWCKTDLSNVGGLPRRRKNRSGAHRGERGPRTILPEPRQSPNVTQVCF